MAETKAGKTICTLLGERFFPAPPRTKGREFLARDMIVVLSLFRTSALTRPAVKSCLGHTLGSRVFDGG